MVRFGTVERTANKALENSVEKIKIAPLWVPHPNNIPQQIAYDSEANIVGFGGAAGGGKSDLIIGKALTKHKKSLILRREFTQATSIERRIKELIGDKGRYNSQKKEFKLKDGRIIDLGSVQHESDKENYQGRDHSLLAFDEATHFTEEIIRYLSIWNRSDDPAEPVQMILSFNPPSSTQGRWIIKFFGPWLDPKHPNPAKPGELRWYAMLDGKEIAVPTGDPIDHNGETIQPLSRTFIPAKVDDNPYLKRTNYKAILQGLPEPLRSMMLLGDFMASAEDQQWQVIPSKWVELSFERWREFVKQWCDGDPYWDENGELVNLPRCFYPNQMKSMGLDPSRGGQDLNVISPLWGQWFAPQIAIPGSGIIDGIDSAKTAIKYWKGGYVNVDIIGVGSSPYDALQQFEIPSYPINASASEPVKEKLDRSGKLGFYNVRAYYHWLLREALDPAYSPTLMLPPSDELLQDLTAATWELRQWKILVEPKEKIKERIGHSPDRSDSLMLALLEPTMEYSSSFGESVEGTVYPGVY